jgi:hypothetical protein
MNLETVVDLAQRLMREYLPMRRVLSLRPGHLMRTRRAPKCWPMTTRAIERLYDYLLPFYPARAYVRKGAENRGCLPK